MKRYTAIYWHKVDQRIEFQTFGDTPEQAAQEVFDNYEGLRQVQVCDAYLDEYTQTWRSNGCNIHWVRNNIVKTSNTDEA